MLLSWGKQFLQLNILNIFSKRKDYNKVLRKQNVPNDKTNNHCNILKTKEKSVILIQLITLNLSNLICYFTGWNVDQITNKFSRIMCMRQEEILSMKNAERYLWFLAEQKLPHHLSDFRCLVLCAWVTLKGDPNRISTQSPSSPAPSKYRCRIRVKSMKYTRHTAKPQIFMGSCAGFDAVAQICIFCNKQDKIKHI